MPYCPCQRFPPPSPPPRPYGGGSRPELIGEFGWASPYNSWNRRPGNDHFMEERPCAPFSDVRDAPFNFDEFYSLFPEFKGSEDYSQALVAAAAKQARFFVKPSWCRELDGPERDYVYNLAVAHIACLLKKQQAGLNGSAIPGTGNFAGADAGPGVVTSASVGGVSVTKTQLSQIKSMWQEWFYQTPYGRTMMVLLEQCASTGFYYEGGENPASWLRP